jgi:hypothetical protein
MASMLLRFFCLAVALGGLCGWKYTLDGPTHRTRENLEKQYQLVESYRLTYGKLPSPREFLAYKETLIPDLVTRHRMSIDGWGRATWVCRRGQTLILRSLGPNGVNDGGGVDDMTIEIEP